MAKCVACSDMLRILVFTDNHCGYAENDPIRGNDSFVAFEEALRFGKNMDCDFAINSGDIFHENRPSRFANHRVLTALRTFCMGDRPTKFELLGDQSRHFGIDTKYVLRRLSIRVAWCFAAFGFLNSPRTIRCLLYPQLPKSKLPRSALQH